jgi:hypothetical protein
VNLCRSQGGVLGNAQEGRTLIDGLGEKPCRLDGLPQEQAALLIGNIGVEIAPGMEVAERGAAHQALSLLQRMQSTPALARCRAVTAPEIPPPMMPTLYVWSIG